MTRRFWQIAAGDRSRDYSPLFSHHDLMFLGLGRFGTYNETTYVQAIQEKGLNKIEAEMIKRFRNDVQDDDIILMARGKHIVDIGIAVRNKDEDYMHDSTFDDVYGWDLSHTHRVIWQKFPNLNVLTGIIARFARVNDDNRKILDPLSSFVPLCVRRTLSSRPERPPAPLELNQLGEELFRRGLANAAVDQVLRAIDRQRRLLQWYDEYGKASNRPDEQEIVAHMVLPLLLALGWSEQLLAVEWRKVDMAGFWDTPTTADKCILVCEAKHINSGLGDVLKQAMNYIKNLQLTNCKKILLTQGGRFYLYNKLEVDSTEPEKYNSLRPTGYINVEKIRTNHFDPADTDAVQTLIDLTPAGMMH